MYSIEKLTGGTAPCSKGSLLLIVTALCWQFTHTTFHIKDVISDPSATLKQHSGPAVHLPFRARVIVYLAVIWSCHATKQHQNPTIILKTLTVNTVSAQSLCHLGWEEDLFKVLQSRTAQ